MWRPGDLIVITAVLVLTSGLAIGIYSAAGVDRVEILSAHGTMESYPAWQAQTLRIDGPLGETVIEIADGSARIVASPCRQKICINRGWMSHSGETAACLPNRISVTLQGDDPRFDAMNF